MPQTATQAGQAMEYMALAGWSVQESISELPNILNLSVASGLELGATSDIITDYLSAFNMKTDEAAHLADVMAYAQSNANTNVEQLAGAYRNCAANANAMGYSVEDVTADLSMMANQGLKGEKAGTTLSAVYRDITKKMKDGKIAINGVNIAVQDQNGNYRKLSSIVKDVAAATDGMGDAQKNAALLSIFTSDSIKGLNLLLNAGGDASEEFAARLEGSTGAASTAAKTMSDNLAGDIESLKGKLEVAGIQIFEVMEEPLRAVVSGVGTVVDKFTELDAETQKLIVTAGAVVAGAPIVTAGISGIAAVVGTLATPVGAVVAAVGAVIAAVAVVESTLPKASAEIEKMTASVHENAQAWEENQKVSEERVAASTVEIDTASQYLEILRENVDAEGNIIGSKAKVKSAIDAINDIMPGAISYINDEKIKYEETTDAIEKYLAKARAQAILDAMRPGYEQAIATQIESRTKKQELLAEQEEKSAESYKLLLDAMKDGMDPWKQTTKDYLSNQEELKKLSSAIAEVDGVIGDCSQTISNYEKAFELMGEGTDEAIDQINNLVQTGFGGLEDIGTEAAASWRDTIGQFPATVETAMSGATAAVSNAKTQIGDQLDEINGTLRSAGANLAAGYSEGIEANAGAPRAAAITMTKGTMQGIATTQESNSPSKVTHQYGIYFAEGFANGITAGKSKAVNAAVALAKAAITAAKNTAKIHSPSVVMRDEVGKMLALGLAEGIKRNSDSAVYAAEAMNDKLLTVTKLYLAEKSRIEKEQDEYDEAERLKNYEKKLKEAKDAEAKQKVIEEEQQRQREQQRKNEEEQQKEYLDKLKELAEASEKQAKSIVETYADMANEVYDDLNDVINAIDSMNNKLNSYGNDRLFTKSTFSDKDGNLLAEWYNLEDISKYTESLKEYGELLYRVKERGADREIFEHLRDMDVDEGITFAQLLLDADDDEFRKYNEQWEQRREASRLIAEALYKDEAEAIRDELLAVLSESTQQFQQYGITAADEYYEGFKTAIDKIKNLFGEISMGQNLRLSYGITGMETGESSASASISISQSFYGDVSPSEAAAETERAVNRITVLGQLGAV